MDREEGALGAELDGSELGLLMFVLMRSRSVSPLPSAFSAAPSRIFLKESWVWLSSASARPKVGTSGLAFSARTASPLREKTRRVDGDVLEGELFFSDLGVRARHGRLGSHRGLVLRASATRLSDLRRSTGRPWVGHARARRVRGYRRGCTDRLDRFRNQGYGARGQ